MSNSSINRALIILAFLNVLIIWVMQSYGDMLKPYGIVAFEFAGDIAYAQSMVSVWMQNNVLNEVFFLLGFDYVFMITYSSFLFLACFKLFTQAEGKLKQILLILAYLQPVAAIFDATENAALYQIANGSLNERWPFIAFYCAAPKFVIVALALITIMGSLVKRLIFKR